MKVITKFNVVLSKPNANGYIYEIKSFKKALKKYLKEDGRIFDKFKANIENEEKVIGKIISYKFKNNEIISECEMDKSLVGKQYSIGCGVVSSFDSDGIVKVDYILDEHINLSYDNQTKEYYKSLRGTKC